MRSVALITELFYPHTGGQEVRFYGFAKGLASRGFRVDVYTADYSDGNLPKVERRDGFRIFRYVSLPGYLRLGSRSPLPLLKYISRTYSLVSRLTSEYDSIIINQMPILHLMFLPKSDKILVDWCEFHSVGRVSLLLRLAARRFTKGVCLSTEIAQRVIRSSPSAKLIVVRTPIDLELYNATSERDADLIVFLGRLTPHKNVESLIEAVAEMNHSRKSQKRLVIVGEGPLKQSLTKQACGMSFVQLLGHVNERTKIGLLRSAWILAIPSLREGLPNVVAESIVSMTPILTVSSPLNGTADFVKAQRIGFVAKSPKSEDIADELASITPQRWLSATANESSIREQFSVETNITKLAEFVTDPMEFRK